MNEYEKINQEIEKFKEEVGAEIRGSKG